MRIEMKQAIKILALSLFVSVSSSAFSQEKETTGQQVKQAGKATGKAVNTAGKKVGEVGAKSAAKVKDKTVKTAKGPNGETVYIDEHERKYYINKQAKRVYLK
jgi:hypothetical protein